MFSQKIYPEQVNSRKDSVHSNVATTFPTRYSSAALLAIVLSLPIANIAFAQQALTEGSVAPMGHWLEYREARYNDKPVLVHLRTGYERAIIMPEPVILDSAEQSLPGCEIVIDNDVVAFYPTQTFPRESVIVIGQQSGIRYDLRIRASTQGLRQPMRLSR